jgi:hypothetical protein
MVARGRLLAGRPGAARRNWWKTIGAAAVIGPLTMQSSIVEPAAPPASEFLPRGMVFTVDCA